MDCTITVDRKRRSVTVKSGETCVEKQIVPDFADLDAIYTGFIHKYLGRSQKMTTAGDITIISTIPSHLR